MHDARPDSHPAAARPADPGPFIVLGLPLGVQVLTMYVLIAVETPLTPMVNRIMERPSGVVMLSAMGLMVVCAVMMVVLGWFERRQKRRQDS